MRFNYFHTLGLGRVDSELPIHAQIYLPVRYTVQWGSNKIEENLIRDFKIQNPRRECRNLG